MSSEEQPSEKPLYRDKRTQRFADGERVREFQAFEALGGNRRGQFSIRINQQWRICFEWPDDADRPFHIEITDYH